MKKLMALILALMLCVGVVACAEGVDTYTSASSAKTEIAGEDLTALAEKLEAQSSLLSTQAEFSAEGYVAKETATNAQLLTVNPNGAVNISTISEWQYNADTEGGLGQVKMKLTYGQSPLNLSEVGAGGTLVVMVDGTAKLLHLNTVSCDVLEYSDEAYDNGEFDHHYSGSAEQKDEYHITCDVLKIETTFVLF